MNCFCLLRSGMEWVIPSERSRLLGFCPITLVPGAPPWLMGACAAEGRALPLIDLSCLLRKIMPLQPPSVLLLMEASTGPLVLGADSWRYDHCSLSPAGPGWYVADPAHPERYLLLPERLSAAMVNGF